MSTPENDKIEISKEEYEKLKENDRWLTCLNNAGVDNWDGIEAAQDILDEWNNEKPEE